MAFWTNWLCGAQKDEIDALRAQIVQLTTLLHQSVPVSNPAAPAPLVTVPPSVAPATPPPVAVPASGGGTIVNSQGIWSIGANNIILRNGIPAAGGVGSQIDKVGDTIVVFGADANWWQWSGIGWTSIGPNKPSAMPAIAWNPAESYPSATEMIAQLKANAFTNIVMLDGRGLIEFSGGFGPPFMYFTYPDGSVRITHP